MTQKPYKAINCGFHDELEAAAVIRKNCKIYYLNSLGVETLYSGRILDFYIKEKVEYMVLEKELIIRLDKIISMDGKINPSDDYCGI